MGGCCGKDSDHHQRENTLNEETDSSQTLLSGEEQDDDDEEHTQHATTRTAPVDIVGQVSMRLEEFAAAREAQERHLVAQRQASLQRHITTAKGLSIKDSLRQGYQLKYHYPGPTLDFSLKLSALVQSCEEYISTLSSQATLQAQSEADALVDELLQLRIHLGPELLPLNIKNAFYRERILIEGGHNERQFRLDCIQFFEPILFYGNAIGEPHELVKLYVFFLIETIKTTPFMSLYLERTCHAGEFYHCLCFFCEGNVRGQFHIYGDRCPSYWELQNDVLTRAKKTVQHIVTGGAVPLPETICVTELQSPREPGPIIL